MFWPWLLKYSSFFLTGIESNKKAARVSPSGHPTPSYCDCSALQAHRGKIRGHNLQTFPRAF